jgi:hypothetical protein
MLAHELSHEPSINIVGAASARRADDRDSFTLVELVLRLKFRGPENDQR